MSKKTVLFYDSKSADANLVQHINKILYGFEDVAVTFQSDTTTPTQHYFPSTIYDSDYGKMFFVGVKPNVNYCKSLHMKDTVFYIFNDGSFEFGYYDSAPNVIVVDKGANKTLSQTFKQLIPSLFIDNVVKHNKINNVVKMHDLVDQYEIYCKTYRNRFIDKLAYGANNYVNKLVDLNKVESILPQLIFNETDKLIKSGECDLLFMLSSNEMNTIVAKSQIHTYITESLDNVVTIKINADINTIKRIDKHLCDFLIENKIPFNVDFVEYYVLTPNHSVNVILKDYATQISPIELKNNVDIFNHIGETTNEKIEAYVLARYPNSILTNNFNGTKSFQTNIVEFFNL